MTLSSRFIVFSILGLFVAAAPVFASSTPWSTTSNCLVALSSSTNSSCWLKTDLSYRGNATRQSNGSVLLKSVSSSPASASWDVNVKAANGTYLVIAGKALADSVRSNSITGLPYLYGYVFDQTSSGLRITSYLQNKTMRFDANAGQWDVVSGIFPIDSNADQVRLFLKQGLRANSPYDGSGATFKDVGIFIVNSQSEANTIIQAYQQSL